MRVLVCGGRNFVDMPLLEGTLDELRPTEIIHGGATGADEMAGAWADRHKIPVQVFKASWGRYSNYAGPERNRRMLREGKPDLVVAFHGGVGTKNMIELAEHAGVEVMRV